MKNINRTISYILGVLIFVQLISQEIAAADTELVSSVGNDQQAEEIAEEDSIQQKIPILSEEWIQKTKNPLPWLSWGADLRAREEYISNTQQNSSAQYPDNNHQRYRYRAWGKISPTDYFSFQARATYVFRYFLDPESSEGGESGEILLDNLFFDLSAGKESPWKLRVGRQELSSLGVLWFIQDGTTKDGSRTTFFDAARFTYNFPNEKTTLDAVYLYQSDRSDAWLPPLGMQESRKYLSEQDVQGGILLLRDKSIQNTVLEGLVVYRHLYPGDLDSSIYGDDVTVRPKISYKLNDNWSFEAEMAGQFGRRNDRDVLAGGALTRAIYSFNDKYKSTVWLGFEYLSGDRGGEDIDNGMDILWGHYPRISDIAAYQRLESGRSCDYTNLVSPFIGYSTYPIDKLRLELGYRPMFAPANPLAGDGIHTEDGSFKGHLLQTKFEYNINKHIQTHLVLESIIPGDYYTDLADDIAFFLRAQVMLTW